MPELEFKLTIRLGNDAMNSRADISAALSKIAEAEDSTDDWPITSPTHATSIFDANGSRVGQWKITEQED